MNSLPKYVASRTLKGTTWNATLIDGDVAARVAELKQRDGLNILKFGTGVLDRTLLEHDLVDEFQFLLYPVTAGPLQEHDPAGGQRLFDGFGITGLTLVDVKTLKSGVLNLVYTPAERRG